jgi:hypothetical protein
MDIIETNTIIDALGGTNTVAALCEITPGAVSQWRNSQIPKPWLAFFKEKRPDLFASTSPKVA